jgi:hypothetical protein
MKMGHVMRLAGFHVHPDNNSEEAAQFRHCPWEVGSLIGCCHEIIAALRKRNHSYRQWSKNVLHQPIARIIRPVMLAPVAAFCFFRLSGI